MSPEVDDATSGREVLGNWFLGPDRLAGAQGSLDERCVAVRRRDDDDGLHVRVVDRVEWIGRRPARLRQRATALGSLGDGIRDDDDAGVGDPGNVSDVRETHATRAKERDPDAAAVTWGEARHRCAV